jgi:hypothetical protein
MWRLKEGSNETKVLAVGIKICISPLCHCYSGPGWGTDYQKYGITLPWLFTAKTAS